MQAERSALRVISEDARRHGVRWAERFCELASAMRASGSIGQPAALEEFWRLLIGVLATRLRHAAPGGGRLDDDALFDIASQKALDIVQRIQSGAWNPQPMRAAQWVVFVRRVARNSVIDVQRSRHREPISHETLAGDGDSLLASFDFRRAQDPSNDLDRARFAKAFFECIRLLTRKAATIFFFRVFYEFSSSQIASHEEVRMNAKAVDVALVRARKAMSGCLARKGFTSSEIPTGVYAELWDYFERART